MSEPPKVEPSPESSPPESVSPLRALTGSLIAATLGLLMYRLMRAIALSFATHPPSTSNQIALNLSIAVRTLVVGLSALATGVFAFAALGLCGLALQLLWRRLVSPNPNLPS